MQPITREGLIRYAVTLEADEYKDQIILQLGRRHYNEALNLCGKAIFELLKKSQSPAERDEKAQLRCQRYKYLERMLLRKAVLVEQGAARTPAPGRSLAPRRKTRVKTEAHLTTNHSKM